MNSGFSLQPIGNLVVCRFRKDVPIHEFRRLGIRTVGHNQPGDLRSYAREGLQLFRAGAIYVNGAVTRPSLLHSLCNGFGVTLEFRRSISRVLSHSIRAAAFWSTPLQCEQQPKDDAS